MKKLLNTLYVTSQDRYLSLEGETIVVKQEGKAVARLPLRNLESIIVFGYNGMSPALMGACAERDIHVSFCSMHGKFLAEIRGPVQGNVFLRKKQYQVSEHKEESLTIAKSFIIGKLYNSKAVISRACRDYPMRIDIDRLKEKATYLRNSLFLVQEADSFEQLRGFEGEAATVYFSVWDELVLQQKEDFRFDRRSKRPPMNRTNALLSFAYSLLGSACTSALECVGLGPFVGFMHTERPGRASLALDLIEELRPIMADRFVLTLINRRIIQREDFLVKENGAVFLNDKGRKKFLEQWQERKKTIIKHPFLNEKVEWGLIPYTQALLLSRHIRGDLNGYPPFFWK